MRSLTMDFLCRMSPLLAPVTASAQNALPLPEVALVSVASLSFGDRIRCHLAVTNARAMTAELFAVMGASPECADAGATRLQAVVEQLETNPPLTTTVCRLARPEDLLALRVDLERTDPPGALRVVLHDRATGESSASLPVTIPAGPLNLLWSRRFGLTAGSDGDDADGDGAAAYLESAFGTDPADSQSVPRLLPGAAAGGALNLRWQSVAGLRYRLRHAANLSQWTPDAEIITGTGGFIETTRPLAAASFWRLEALAPVESDADGDGLTDYEEAIAGSNPAQSDSDGDGVTDTVELLAARTNPLAPPSPALLSAGRIHSAAIKQDGTLWTWGGNEDGQLGDGSNTRRPQPVMTGTDRDWFTVSSGAYHTLAVKQNGELWAWGINSHGQLGAVGNGDRRRPLLSGSETDWLAVSANGLFSIALKRDGSLWGWGDNSFNQLDHQNSFLPVPTRIGTDEWSSVSAGNRHVLAIRQDGTLWGWGDNRWGQAGGPVSRSDMPVTRIATAGDWMQVAAGNYHSGGIRRDGSLWTWGLNDNGQIGNGTTSLQFTPVRIGAEAEWKQVAVLDASTIALKRDGTVWAWGSNFDNRLGLGPDAAGRSRTASLIPVRIAELSECAAIEGGASHAFALLRDGSLSAWGSNDHGQQGRRHYLAPQRIGNSSDWNDGACSLRHNAFVRNDGSLWTWGDGGLLGDGTYSSSSEPVRIGTSNAWTSVAASQTHTLAIGSGGSLHAWGSNSSGQLGLGDTAESLTPAEVIPTRNWTQVAAAGLLSLGIAVDGSLWGWGIDTGLLGTTGFPQHRTNPYRIGADTGWSAVATNGRAILLRSDGTLWVAGTGLPTNLAGVSSSAVPVQVNADTGWRAVVAGDAYGMALKHDGTLWGWGDNTCFKLGIAAPSWLNSVTRLGDADDWTVIAAGSQNGAGIKSDGSLWTWGCTGSGDMGFGRLTGPSLPAMVGSDRDWAGVKAGTSHFVAWKTDGSLWSWGDDYYCQLGLATLATVGSGFTHSDWALPEDSGF
jgi:alpha-tubulin suppressor-like RCC1 family protein